MRIIYTLVLFTVLLFAGCSGNKVKMPFSESILQEGDLALRRGRTRKQMEDEKC